MDSDTDFNTISKDTSRQGLTPYQRIQERRWLSEKDWLFTFLNRNMPWILSRHWESKWSKSLKPIGIWMVLREVADLSKCRAHKNRFFSQFSSRPCHRGDVGGYCLQSPYSGNWTGRDLDSCSGDRNWRLVPSSGWSLYPSSSFHIRTRRTFFKPLSHREGHERDATFGLMAGFVIMMVLDNIFR